MNLNHPAIEVGPPTAADLDRATNTGRIYMHPPMLPAGCDQSGRYLTRQWGRATLDACAVEGGTHADPAPALSPAVGARIGAAINARAEADRIGADENRGAASMHAGNAATREIVDA